MCYLGNILEFPLATIDTICHHLKDPKFGKVDMVVGTGISGTLVLLPVSVGSGIPCGIIRKHHDLYTSPEEGGTHSASRVEALSKTRNLPVKYVIIDDLIESGKTIMRIVETMSGVYASADCGGIILYNTCSNRYPTAPAPCTNITFEIKEVQTLRSKGGDDVFRVI